MNPPGVVSIAGSDSGGGAGIQADLKTFCAHGVYGLTVVTAVTAQNTVEVTAVHPVPASVVASQIDAVFSDIQVSAIKIGMLANAAIVQAVAEGLRRHELDVPVVLDPVMIAKSGDALLAAEAVAALLEELLPLATLVTPNLPEAAVLIGSDPAENPDRGKLLSRLSGLGPAVLLKGGHQDGSGSAEIEDVLVSGGVEQVFRHPRIPSASTHGTGCTLSAAIASLLALGESLPQAVEAAIRYLQGAIQAAYRIQIAPSGGHGPVHHLYRSSSRA